MTFVCFALAWVVTFALSNAEWLRKIQGENFLILWPIFGILTAVFMYGVLSIIASAKAHELCEQEIKPAVISHVDIPHLKATSDRIVALQLKVYYLLRLYLLGVITYKEGMLRVDEERLKSLMDQGGRHSKIAYSILHDVRETGERAMDQVLPKIPHYNSTDDHELAKKVAEFTRHVTERTSRVLSAGFGMIWGVGCAKFFLGISNDQPVQKLMLLFFFAFFLSMYVYFGCLGSVIKDAEKKVNDAIGENFRQRPQLTDMSVVAQLNDQLPLETERHKILNGYYLATSTLVDEALKTPEGTFMHDWASTYLSQLEKVKKEIEEEAVRKAASDSSGCSGCSSCSSCSSCGGCGGCGGCGD